MGVRKNQKKLSSKEWKALIAAIDAMHGSSAAAPAYRRFVTLHVDAMSMAHIDWSVHTMSMNGGAMVRGKNFLTWHRRLVKLFETRLQAVDPAVTVPYWNSVEDRAIPAALDDPALLKRWSVTRAWNASKLAKAADLSAAQNYTGTFTGLQTLVEGAIHSDTHNAVGGDMMGSASPTDPLFWLHHAFIDKTWADWQASSNGSNPPTPNLMLKPANMAPGVPFGVTVSSLLSIAALGYSYG
jgi:tyrosinase